MVLSFLRYIKANQPHAHQNSRMMNDADYVIASLIGIAIVDGFAKFNPQFGSKRQLKDSQDQNVIARFLLCTQFSFVLLWQ
jgi:hypothetical protein